MSIVDSVLNWWSGIAPAKASVSPAEAQEEARQADEEFRKLERAINAVGRARAFQRAVQLGWGHCPAPPVYVWWEIVRELQGQRLAAGQAVALRGVENPLGLAKPPLDVNRKSVHSPRH